MLPPRLRPAGTRDAGAVCAHCDREIQLQESVAACSQCGRVHHETCWYEHQGCGSYGCVAEQNLATGGPSVKITLGELESAAVPTKQAHVAPGDPTRRRRTRVQLTHWNKLCIIAFVLALVGVGLASTLLSPWEELAWVPAIVFLTAPLAALLGVLGLASRQPYHKGLPLALLAILMGLGEVAFLSLYFFVELGGLGAHGVVIMDDAEVDPSVLLDLPAPIARGMKANVIIETQGKLGMLSQALGSGVILKMDKGTALVVTNRHVVDMDYSGPGDGGDNDPIPASKVDVTMFGEQALAGTVVWIAPYGIDLALVRVIGVPNTEHVASAIWDSAIIPKIGEPVFAVGNPHGLSWTHTEGNISQKRRQHAGPLNIDLLQTSAAINMGNSGGGLYDADGRLIGINTYTQDKRVAEGLGFALSFADFLKLVPDEFEFGPARAESSDKAATDEPAVSETPEP